MRARRPGRSGIHRSADAAPSRNGERGWAAREHARPVPGILKAWHLPKCNGATSKPPRERPIRQAPPNSSPFPGEEQPPATPPISPWGHRVRWRAAGPRPAKRFRVQTDPHAVGCSGRVLEQPLERPLARARAGAQAPIPKDAPPSRLAAQPKAPENHRQTDVLAIYSGGHLATE